MLARDFLSKEIKLRKCLILYKSIAMICFTLLHFENFSFSGGLYITQLNIYDGVSSMENSKPLSIFTKKLHRRYSLGFSIRLCFLKTLQKIYFFKVFYIRLLKSVISLRYFTSFNSSNTLLNI